MRSLIGQRAKSFSALGRPSWLVARPRFEMPTQRALYKIRPFKLCAWRGMVPIQQREGFLQASLVIFGTVNYLRHLGSPNTYK